MRITSPWGHMGADAFPGAGADNPLHRKLFQAVSEYAAFVEQWEPSYAGYTFPRFDGFAVTDRFASASLLSSYALGEETLRASFTENGKEGEGMFAASVVDFGSVDIAAGLPVGYIIPRADGGYYMAYNVMAVTAAKDTFIEWESVLTKCLGTLAYSESFVKATEQAGEEKVAMSKEISRITNERLEIIMAAWEDPERRAGHHQPDAERRNRRLRARVRHADRRNLPGGGRMV